MRSPGATPVGAGTSAWKRRSAAAGRRGRGRAPHAGLPAPSAPHEDTRREDVRARRIVVTRTTVPRRLVDGEGREPLSLDDRHALLARLGDEVGVEVATAHDVDGPLEAHVALVAAVDDPALPARHVRNAHLEAERRERRARVPREATAAGLVAGKARLVEDDDPRREPRIGLDERHGGRDARGAGTRDDDVVVDRRRHAALYQRRGRGA